MSGMGGEDRTVHSERPSRGFVVCLLPARNAAEDLAHWFESVARFADAVVALDDGSTDGTADVLSRHPLVKVLLRNPAREDHVGWNDSVNRNRLLEAAGALEPDWIISVDADERVPREDGEALGRFIEEQAVPGIAYGFPRYRMIDDIEHHDGRENRAYRLFAYRADQVFPDERLHFMPVPTSIPRSRWLATNIRIQHLSGLTPERRQARRQKYREADPDQRWGQDYSYVEAPPREVASWPRRRAGAPVILEAIFDDWDPITELDLDWPVASVVLIVDELAVDAMVGVVDAVRAQDCRHPYEIIALARGDEVADDIARMRPGTTVVVVPPRSSPGSWRNVALRIARGDYVVFFDAPATLAPGALRALVEAHDQGCAIVSGDSANLVQSATGWASYFDDGEHFSFAREPLLGLGGFDEWIMEGVEARARDRLIRRGQRSVYMPLVTYGHRTELTTSRDYMSERFALGRAMADLSTMVPRDCRRVAATWRGLPGASPDAAAAFERVRTLVLGGVLARWAGAAYEQLQRSYHEVERNARHG